MGSAVLQPKIEGQKPGVCACYFPDCVVMIRPHVRIICWMKCGGDLGTRFVASMSAEVWREGVLVFLFHYCSLAVKICLIKSVP